MKSSTPLTEGNQATIASQKYQKAIKEINKLILINTTTKKELISLQEKYQCLQHKYSELEQECLSLGKGACFNLEEKNLPKMARIAISNEETSQVIPEETERLAEMNKHSKESVNQLTIPNKSLENTGTISDFTDTKRKFEEYEERMLEKDVKIEEMLKQLGEKNKENSQLYEKCIELMNNRISNKKEEESKAEVERVQEEKIKIQTELQACQQEIQKLNKEILLLSKKEDNMLKLSFCSNEKLSNHENSRVQTEREKIHKTISHIELPKVCSVGQEQIKFDPISEHYERRIKELEGEIVRMIREFDMKKSKYKSLIASLRLENEKLDKFAKKQQSFIEDYANKNSMGASEERGLKLNKSEVPFRLQVEKIKPIMQKSQLVDTTYQPNSAREKRTQQEEYNDLQFVVPSGRVKTMESEESAKNSPSKLNINLRFNNQSKHRFMEGTKYYK